MYRPTDAKPVTQPVTTNVAAQVHGASVVHLDDFMVVKDIKNWKFGPKSGPKPGQEANF
jgi:hypothetical protein